MAKAISKIICEICKDEIVVCAICYLDFEDDDEIECENYEHYHKKCIKESKGE